LGFVVDFCDPFGDGPIGGSGEQGGGPGGAPLSTNDKKKFDSARDKALKRIDKLEKKGDSKCAKFLGRAGISLNDLQAAVNSIQAFDGGRSRNITNGDAGTIDLQDPDVMKESAQDRTAALNSPVSSFFSGNSIYGAVTGRNGSVFFNTHSGLNSSSIFHEALHVATGMGDFRLATALGVKGFTAAMGASQAINQALHDNGCL
jgi:hypothetical protein